MQVSNVLWAEVDEQGRLVVPVEVAEAYGLAPGGRARIELGDGATSRPAALASSALAATAST